MTLNQMPPPIPNTIFCPETYAAPPTPKFNRGPEDPIEI